MKQKDNPNFFDYLVQFIQYILLIFVIVIIYKFVSFIIIYQYNKDNLLGYYQLRFIEDYYDKADTIPEMSALIQKHISFEITLKISNIEYECIANSYLHTDIIPFYYPVNPWEFKYFFINPISNTNIIDSYITNYFWKYIRLLSYLSSQYSIQEVTKNEKYLRIYWNYQSYISGSRLWWFFFDEKNIHINTNKKTNINGYTWYFSL